MDIYIKERSDKIEKTLQNITQEHIKNGVHKRGKRILVFGKQGSGRTTQLRRNGLLTATAIFCSHVPAEEIYKFLEERIKGGWMAIQVSQEHFMPLGQIVFEGYDGSDWRFNKLLHLCSYTGYDVFISTNDNPQKILSRARMENLYGGFLIIEAGYPGFDHIVHHGKYRQYGQMLNGDRWTQLKK